MGSKIKEAINLDAILLELGQFGKFQLINYFYIVIPIIFSAIYNSQYIFAAASAEYRCRVPECESEEPIYNESWWSMALPAASEARCSRFAPINLTGAGPTCDPALFTQETLRCDSWVYLSHDSIVAEFNLACEEWKRTLVGTMHSVGLFAALAITGYVSDRYGRRTALILTAVSGAVVGLVRSFSTSYPMYITLEFLEATLGSGVYSTGFLLALELVGPSKRVIGGNVISIFYAIGQVICALIAWWIPYWRTFTRVIYAPSLLFIFYYFIVVESVRWLLSKGRKAEAIEIIKNVAKTNKKTLSKTSLATLELDINTSTNDEPANVHKPSLVTQVLKSPIILSRLFICSFWWITVTFVYYGLSINAVSLDGNGYVNYILVSLVEIPGYFLSMLLLERFGRKASIMTAYFICGASLIALPFVPESISWAATCLSMLGKLCISMTFSSIYIYTSELFPTSMRHSLLGFCSMIGRIGSIVAPQTPLLASYMPSLPYLLFGAFCITAAFLMILTPETLHAKLPDTIHEAEDIAKLKMDTKMV